LDAMIGRIPSSESLQWMSNARSPSELHRHSPNGARFRSTPCHRIGLCWRRRLHARDWSVLGMACRGHTLLRQSIHGIRSTLCGARFNHSCQPRREGPNRNVGMVVNAYVTGLMSQRVRSLARLRRPQAVRGASRAAGRGGPRTRPSDPASSIIRRLRMAWRRLRSAVEVKRVAERPNATGPRHDLLVRQPEPALEQQHARLPALIQPRPICFVIAAVRLIAKHKPRWFGVLGRIIRSDSSRDTAGDSFPGSVSKAAIWRSV